MSRGFCQLLPLCIGLGCKSKPVPEPHNLQLSVIDADEDDCAWIRYEISPPTCELIAWSEQSCSEGIEMSWHEDADRALLRWGGETGAALEVAFEDESAEVRDLPFPPLGGLRALGYNPSGSLTALTVDQSVRRERYNGTLVINFRGERFFVEDDLQTEGVIALAHSFRWDEGAWVLQATNVTDDGWEFAMAEEILADDPSMVPAESEHRSTEPVAARALEDTRAERRLRRWKPDRPGLWRTLGTDHGEIVWWREFVKSQDTESVSGISTVPLLYRTRDRWREIPLHYPIHSEVSIEVDGPLVVITREGSSTQVFDLRTAKMVARIDAPISMALWPSG